MMMGFSDCCTGQILIEIFFAKVLADFKENIFCIIVIYLGSQSILNPNDVKLYQWPDN